LADITKIVAHVRTADLPRAGNYGWVYLGIAGREFLLNAAGPAGTERGDSWTFVLGEDSNVENASHNDPRKPQLDTDDLDRYPTYIHFEPAGHHPAWCLVLGAGLGHRQPRLEHAAVVRQPRPRRLRRTPTPVAGPGIRQAAVPQAVRL
jgi:hypothetical protein